MMIDLEKTVFRLDSMIEELQLIPTFRGGKLETALDFGTVFLGMEHVVDDEHWQRLCEVSAPGGDALIWKAPSEWRFPQLLRALGAFKSSSRAAKNGWNKDIPAGITEVQFKINKRRGTLWIHRITDGCPWR